MERTRHMVDISDYAWGKLERLASRLDASVFLYKGRPRYGKLIELAIEKLEDSTMEWTVEEVELAQEEVPAAWWDDTAAAAKPAEWDSKKGWWKGDKLDKYKPELAAQGFVDVPDPATIHEADVWTYPPNANFTSVGTTLKLHARTDKEWTSEQVTQAQDAVSYAISGAAWLVKPFHVSYVGGVGYFEYSAVINMHNSSMMDLVIGNAKGALGNALIELGLSGTKQHPPLHNSKKEQEAKKVTANDPNIKTHSKVSTTTHENGSVVVILTCELTQALSAKQQVELRSYTESIAKKYVKSLGSGELFPACFMTNIPWNKLRIELGYSGSTMLTTTVNVVAHNLCMALEAWLLQGNFIGPLPQAVDITEKKPNAHPKYHTSWSFKPENKLDKNGTMQLRDVHTFVVSNGFVLENSKFEISERIKGEVAMQYGYGFMEHQSSGNWPELTWSLDGKTLLIKVSVKRKDNTPAMFSVQKVGDAVIAYLSKMLDTYYTL